MLAVPVPPEHEAAGAEVEAAIGAALREAEARGVAGSQVRGRLYAREAGASRVQTSRVRAPASSSLWAVAAAADSPSHVPAPQHP